MTDKPGRPGRPRKWDTNAERSREYRRRRRTDLAQPMLLLARAAELERELRHLRGELARTRRQLIKSERQLAQLREKHDAHVERTASTQGAVLWRRNRLDARREHSRSIDAFDYPEPDDELIDLDDDE